MSQLRDGRRSRKVGNPVTVSFDWESAVERNTHHPEDRILRCLGGRFGSGHRRYIFWQFCGITNSARLLCHQILADYVVVQLCMNVLNK